MNVLVIGAGCCGASAARCLAELGCHVTVADQRNHVAGNAYDTRDEMGFLYHVYGPHIFFTNDEVVWKFVYPFAEWVPFRCSIQVHIEGKNHWMPFQPALIQQLMPEDGNIAVQTMQQKWKDRESVSILELMSSEDAILRKVGQRLYECDCKPYNQKQWGMRPEQLSPEVIGRAPVYLNDRKEFRSEKFQYMPAKGFTSMFGQMLNHPNIEVLLNTNSSVLFELQKNEILWKGRQWDAVLYTGRLDQLFQYSNGTLPYRSLHFDHQYVPEKEGLPCMAVYYPEEQFPWTRCTDYRFLPGEGPIHGKTLMIGECPVPVQDDKDDPYYVVLTEDAKAMYQLYQNRLNAIPHLYAAGRLAEFRYYNMDMAIRKGLDVAEQVYRQEGS